MATDRSGRYLLSAYYLAGKAAVHAIDGDGYVIDPPMEWRDTGRGAHCFQTDPSNRFAFVPHIADEGGRNAIFQFRFDATTGRLSPNGPAQVEQDPGVGPRHFCFHPSKDILYFSNEQECSVSAYGFDPSTGSLSHLQTVSALPAVWSGANACSQIQISPYGRFLYAPVRGHDSIATFEVDAGSGRLNLTGHTLTERMPRAFTLDPDGRFLLSAGEKSGRLAVFRIDGDSGKLDRIGVHMVGRTPLWVTVI
jgi:6-phosphogluconolactonase